MPLLVELADDQLEALRDRAKSLEFSPDQLASAAVADLVELKRQKARGRTYGSVAGSSAMSAPSRPNSIMQKLLPACLLAVALSSAAPAQAVSSAELYQNESYTYGRFEARIQFAAGDGVVSSFFLWKPGSEIAGTFWNELDFEKLGADCRMQTNPLYGAPVVDHGRIESVSGDLCLEYHTYTFEWTPTYIAWLIDGVEVRREEGEAAAAFELNAASGMQIHFNLWPGDASFGGNFDPTILPVHQHISWVQYSSFESGTFVFDWREDFTAGALPTGWAIGNWPSPKNYSTHAAANVGFKSNIAVLSLTADDATGFAGEPPPDETVDSGSGGATGGNPGSDSGTAEAGRGAAANGTGGTVATNEVSSGAAGTVSMNGGAGGTTLTDEPSGSRGNSGCSVGTGASGGAAHWAWLVLAGAVLASRRHSWARSSCKPCCTGTTMPARTRLRCSEGA